MSQKLIVLARNAEVKEQTKGILVNGAVELLYNIGMNLRASYFPEDISPSQCFMFYSGKKESKDSGRAVLAGLLNSRENTQKRPSSVENLDKLCSDKVVSLVENDLDDLWIKFNKKSKLSDEQYFQWWSCNSDAVKMDKAEITKFKKLMINGTACLGTALNKLVFEDKSLVLLETHRFIIESLFMAALSSSRSNIDFSRIGGLFGLGEYAVLSLNEPIDGVFKFGNLYRGENSYKINLSSFTRSEFRA